MSLTIDEPDGEVACDCANGNKVCVKGDGAIKDGVLAEAVYAKIYQPPDAPVNPGNGPPAGAVSTTVSPGGNWKIGLLGGADCSSSSPYPDNRIWVWAKYLVTSSSSSSSSSEEYTYEAVSSPFTGRCDENVTC